ncbi:Uncharacterised protein [Zhongshania aliphaticivorans]|uniref:Uncharacterized protein n=1 Tax=Zhongshania aliphaticivorans TaxID=1470434 RepID=A0A5S9MY46_9GAMM|nr:hypothetical protein [Zhongshania aliphaticivorans]CAA0081388.1 Uncharacterised protein [Zhongshania aliphaticivorans]CAA0085055.1 Uncharacterised protein [Zhongshania aliphaticivorans]
MRWWGAREYQLANTADSSYRSRGGRFARSVGKGESVGLAETLLYGAIMAVFSFVGSFAAMRVELKWIKDDLNKKGDRLNNHSDRIRQVEIKLGN